MVTDYLDYEFQLALDAVYRAWKEYWDILRIYLQVISFMLVVEGYLLAEYVLPTLSNGLHNLNSVSLILSTFFIPFFIFIIGIYINNND